MNDISSEAAILYGYVVNYCPACKHKKYHKDTGEEYYGIGNVNIKEYYQMSNDKIRRLMNELIEAGYIDVYMNRRPNVQYRYLKCNKIIEGQCYYVFYELIPKNEKKSLHLSSLISFIVKDININGNDFLSKEEIKQKIGCD